LLLPGKIAPEYALGADLSIGGSVVSSALCEVCGTSRAQLREMYNSLGDLGDVAQVRHSAGLVGSAAAAAAARFAMLLGLSLVRHEMRNSLGDLGDASQVRRWWVCCC
jgi:hypothetical protein